MRIFLLFDVLAIAAVVYVVVKYIIPLLTDAFISPERRALKELERQRRLDEIEEAKALLNAKQDKRLDDMLSRVRLMANEPEKNFGSGPSNTTSNNQQKKEEARKE